MLFHPLKAIRNDQIASCFFSSPLKVFFSRVFFWKKNLCEQSRWSDAFMGFFSLLLLVVVEKFFAQSFVSLKCCAGREKLIYNIYDFQWKKSFVHLMWVSRLRMANQSNETEWKISSCCFTLHSFIFCATKKRENIHDNNDNKEFSSKAKAYCYDLPIFHFSCSPYIWRDAIFMAHISFLIFNGIPSTPFDVIDLFFGNFCSFLENFEQSAISI